VVIIYLLVSLFLCNGCTYVRDLPQRDPFVKLYTFQPSKQKESLQKKDKKTSLTISAKNMPLSSFCRIISDKTFSGIVYNNSLSNSAITGEFKISNVGEVLNVIARQLNVECLKVGDTYFLGNIKKEDRGILVKKVRGYSPDELRQCIRTLLSDVGKVQVFQSGTICVSDREHVLTRVSQMCDSIEAGFSGSWIVQLYFVVVRKDALLEAGFDMQSSGKLSYDISNSTLSVEDLKLDGLFNLISRSNFADMYASPMLLLRDGVKGTWRDGERIPIPKKVVSQYGVVETQGFEYIDTGLNIDSTIRESKNGAVLNLSISLSDVKGYVEYAPITSHCEFTAECELKQNKVYLIGEMARYKVLDTQKKILNLGTDRGKSTVQVWGCVYRIGEICKGKILKPRNNVLKGVQSLL
jgi:type II secretory pathway component GspD/PulD (secretin)